MSGTDPGGARSDDAVFTQKKLRDLYEDLFAYGFDHLGRSGWPRRDLSRRYPDAIETTGRPADDIPPALPGRAGPTD